MLEITLAAACQNCLGVSLDGFYHHWLLGLHPRKKHVPWRGWAGKSPCIGQVECGNVGLDLFRLHFARWAVIKILGDWFLSQVALSGLSICASGFGRLGFARIISNYHAILAQVS